MNLNFKENNKLKKLETQFYKLYYKNKHPSWMFIGAYGIGKTYQAIKISKFLLNGSSELYPDDKYISNNPNFFHVKRLNETKSGIITKKQIDEVVIKTKLKSSNSLNIIIINKLDYVSRDTMNSILKVIEEPPEGWLFIFIVDNYSKIQKTISSRCQKLFFPKLVYSEFLTILEKKNNLELSKDEIIKLSLISNNSPGLAINMYNLSLINTYNDFLKSFENKVLINNFLKNFLDKFEKNSDLCWVFNVYCQRLFYLVLLEIIEISSNKDVFLENEKNIINALSIKYKTDTIFILEDNLKIILFRIETLNSNPFLELKNFMYMFHRG